MTDMAASTNNRQLSRNSISMSANAAFHGGTEDCMEATKSELYHALEKLERGLKGNDTLADDLTMQEVEEAHAFFQKALLSVEVAIADLEVIGDRWGG